MNNLYLFLLVLVAALSCKENSVEPISSKIPDEVLSRISITQTTYDSLLIRSDSLFVLSEPQISFVTVGIDSGTIIGSPVTQPAQYHKVANGYRLIFSKVISFRLSGGRVVPIAVQYTFSDGTAKIYKATLNTLPFPYQNTRVVWEGAWWSIDVWGNKLYVTDGSDTFENDLINQSQVKLFARPNTYFLARESSYVFYCIEQDSVFRFNLDTQSRDKLMYRARLTTGTYVTGLTTYGGKLIIRLAASILTLDLNGARIDSSGFPFIVHSGFAFDGTFFYSGILSSGYDKWIAKISAQGIPVSMVKSPALPISSFQTRNGVLYFADWRRSFVGSVQMSSLTEMPIRAPWFAATSSLVAPAIDK